MARGVATSRRGGHLREHLLGARRRATCPLDSPSLLPQPRLAVRARPPREERLAVRLARGDREAPTSQHTTRERTEDRRGPRSLPGRRSDLRRDRLQRCGDQRGEEKRPDRLLVTGNVGAPLPDGSKGPSDGATSLEVRRGRPPARRGRP